MRHLAMTGMVTASMIDLIRSGSDIRATPPSLRMSAGTRSRAITAQAPASCAMRACSGVTTSMITPPLSIWASPALTLNDPFTDLSPLRAPLPSVTFEILRRARDTSAGLRWCRRPVGQPARPRRRAAVAGSDAEPAHLPVVWGLEALEDQRSLGRVFVVGQQAVPVQPREHVHLLEHVQERRHRAPSQVGV